ncbi:MAG: N-acetyltransferase [Chloroflexota bacterium]|jgi:predicted GNAT family acetyltransferase|nr:N-acetyltransferase [Caldilinea sp.]GIK74278.1 MAG: N-acetyltransferase [Chloroflexota bacterium]
MSTAVEVVHNEAKNRFEVSQEGHLAELDYQRTGAQIIFTHTEVPPALEGRGIAGALVKTGLNYARDHGLEVVPLCPFVKGYIERKPEYQALVKQESSGGFA